MLIRIPTVEPKRYWSREEVRPRPNVWYQCSTFSGNCIVVKHRTVFHADVGKWKRYPNRDLLAQRWKDREFLELREEWYGKLKDEGFVDIENVNWVNGVSGGEMGSRGLLNKPEGPTFGSQADYQRKYTPDKEEFWRCLSKWSWMDRCGRGVRFSRHTRRNRRIIRLLCDGLSTTQVATKMCLSKRIVTNVFHKEVQAMRKYIEDHDL